MEDENLVNGSCMQGRLEALLGLTQFFCVDEFQGSHAGSRAWRVEGGQLGLHQLPLWSLATGHNR